MGREEGYARLAPEGFVTVPSLVDILQAAMRDCQAAGEPALLVDLRRAANPALSTTDRYDLAEGVAHFWARAIRLAVLAREDQIDPRRFGLQVARNRGLVLGLFLHEEEAIAWLTGTTT